MAELKAEMEVRDCSSCINAQAAVAIEMASNASRIKSAQVTPAEVLSKIGRKCVQERDELIDLYPGISVTCAMGAWGVIDGSQRA